MKFFISNNCVRQNFAHFTTCFEKYHSLLPLEILHFPLKTVKGTIEVFFIEMIQAVNHDSKFIEWAQFTI